MIVWDGKDIIGLFVLGGIVAIAIFSYVVYAIVCGINKVVDKLRKENHNDDENTQSRR